MKVSGTLINCAKNEDKSQLVFTQTVNDVLSFLVVLPETGYYKFQVCGLFLGANEIFKSQHIEPW